MSTYLANVPVTVCKKTQNVHVHKFEIVMIIKIIIHDYQIFIDIQHLTGIKTCQGNSVSTTSLFGPNLRQASVRSHSGNILLGLTGIPLMVKCHVLLKYDKFFGIIL